MPSTGRSGTGDASIELIDDRDNLAQARLGGRRDWWHFGLKLLRRTLSDGRARLLRGWDVTGFRTV